jgi:hypothetical protein
MSVPGRVTMISWPSNLTRRSMRQAYHKQGRRPKPTMKKPGAAAASRGFYAASSVWGFPTRGSYYNNAARCVLDVTVQCKILEHAILYRVELHASDTVA